MRFLIFLVTLSAAAPLAQADPFDSGAVPTGSLEILARFYGPGPSGIAVTPEGRIFVGFPRHADDHQGPTLGELRQGKLVPYPNKKMSLPSDAPADERLISVHGMTTDSRGRLWVIDEGKRAGQPIPEGGAKVVGFDPANNRVIASAVIKPPALLPDSHLNDLRVDLTHGAKGTVYIADSSFGVSPALLVVDLATGAQRRVLGSHPSTQPEPGFLIMLEGKPMRYDAEHPTFPSGGVDGITLSADSTRLFYAPLCSRRLYSVPTKMLADFHTSDEALAAAVKDLGEKGAADGLATDPNDRIYTTDFEHDAILCRESDGRFNVVVRDPRLVWPDGIFATDRFVYCTLSQWNRLPDFNDGQDLRQPPYLLIRSLIRPVPEIGKNNAPEE